jgi:alginate O-acetyltransferase complex protein AlgI
MLFNSAEFAIFLPLVLVIWWWTSAHPGLQGKILCAASLVFYAFNSIWECGLLVGLSVMDYLAAIKISDGVSFSRKRAWLLVSLAGNLATLALFKYSVFAAGVFSSVSLQIPDVLTTWLKEILLPVGISFYTFQKMAYVIDVYRGSISAERSFSAFLSFIAFFPQLVAGPIERAGHLLPQFKESRTFSSTESVDGLRLILAGLLRKVVVSDQCAVAVDAVFSSSVDHSGNTLFIAVLLFSIQIYCDFSGYSDMAVGIAKLFGFSLSRNFRNPYFGATDPSDFWRRWHISLSTWFRDYVYFPLGGNRRGMAMMILNTMIVFLVSGLWHGAGWNFIAWGALHGIVVSAYLASGLRERIQEGSGVLNFCLRLAVRATTLMVVGTSWVFFRSETISGAFEFLRHLLIDNWLAHPGQLLLLPRQLLLHDVAPAVCLFMLLEYVAGDDHHWMQWTTRIGSGCLRWCVYCAAVYVILWNSAAPKSFIYFAF